MVYSSLVRLASHKKFIDSIRISARGGKGGHGLPKCEGVGGKGGDVYAQAHKNITLQKLKREFPSQRFIAGRGKDSSKNCILGEPGKDVFVKCPTGVAVVADNGRILGELNEDGEVVLLSLGGCGGNFHTDYLGQAGQSLSVTLDLKLVADVGFVGYPNAGKSTLLKALSRAQPKIASYPFTTIHPNIGIIQYDDFRTISAADLPGLIEGAHVNFGMGHKFLKHTLRTKILLLVVDIDGFRLSPNHSQRSALETILFLNKELELYKEELLLKPVVLAINKIDNCDPAIVSKLQDAVWSLKEKIDKMPEEMRPNNLINFDAVIPISAKKGDNIDELKRKIRAIIDIYHERKLAEEKTESCSPSESAMYI